MTERHWKNNFIFHCKTKNKFFEIDFLHELFLIILHEQLEHVRNNNMFFYQTRWKQHGIHVQCLSVINYENLPLKYLNLTILWTNICNKNNCLLTFQLHFIYNIRIPKFCTLIFFLYATILWGKLQLKFNNLNNYCNSQAKPNKISKCKMWHECF